MYIDKVDTCVRRIRRYSLVNKTALFQLQGREEEKGREKKLEEQIQESTQISNSVSNNSVDLTKSPIISTGLKSYYKHQPERIAHQAEYDESHKEQKKASDAKHYQKRKEQKEAEEKRLKEQYEKQVEEFFVGEGFLGKYAKVNIDRLRQLTVYAFKEERESCQLSSDNQKLAELNQLEADCLHHQHGAPRKDRHHYREHKGLLAFHITEPLCIDVTERGVETVRISNRPFSFEKNGETLNRLYCIFFGFQAGDSMTFKNSNGRICCINFDGSGLDIADVGVFSRLQEVRIKTGKKGVELVRFFAENYSKDTYCRFYRGTKIFIKMG